MIKRIVEISSAGTHLSVRDGQLVLRRNGDELSRIPCEDVGIVLVDHVGTTYTHCVFTELLRCGAAVVLCGGDHHPTGMLLPIDGNTTQTERYRAQIEAAEPVKKRLWRQIVRAKIRHQAVLVGPGNDTYRALMALREKVRSADAGNVESQASRRFWRAYFGEDFRRSRAGAPPNNLLNYGYIVMRAAVARAVCSAGLLPSLGIHHCNRYNAFCLADDLMEPFRGYIERRVKQLWTEGIAAIDQEVKGRLLEVLFEQATIGGFTGPLMVGLHRTGASLYRCFAGEQQEVDLPDL